METKANPNQPRVAARINPKLEKKLSAYLTAAGAAGVGLMALAKTSEAKIVYKPTNIQVTFEAWTPVDLNSDGVSDASVLLGPGAKGILMYAGAPAGNGVRLNHNSNAVAGFFGLPTGPGEKFGGSKFAADVRQILWIRENQQLCGIRSLGERYKSLSGSAVPHLRRDPLRLGAHNDQGRTRNHRLRIRNDSGYLDRRWSSHEPIEG